MAHYWKMIKSTVDKTVENDYMWCGTSKPRHTIKGIRLSGCLGAYDIYMVIENELTP